MPRGRYRLAPARNLPLLVDVGIISHRLRVEGNDIFPIGGEGRHHGITENVITLDTESMADDTDVDQQGQTVIPSGGAVVMAFFR
jgi:hypothetical protein